MFVLDAERSSPLLPPNDFQMKISRSSGSELSSEYALDQESQKILAGSASDDRGEPPAVQIGELQATAFKDDELGKVEEDMGDAHYLQVPPRALDKKGDGLPGQVLPKGGLRSSPEGVCTQLRSFFHTKQLERQSQPLVESLNAETNSLRRHLSTAR